MKRNAEQLDLAQPGSPDDRQSTEGALLRRMGGQSWTVFAYIAREFIVSFLVSFAFFFFIFFINQLLLLAEDILQKDVALLDVARLVVYSLPSIIALSVPFATLVGTLMAVGRLSGDNEIVALRANGFPLLRVFSPILVLAFLLSGFSFVTNDILLPLGTLNFGRLYRELLYQNPALELDPNAVKRYQNDVLITGSIEPGMLDSFAIIDTDGQGNRRVITATAARLLREGDPNAISLELADVTVHTAVSGTEHNYSTADLLRYNILLEDITVAVRTPGPREMSARDVAAEIAEKEAQLAPRFEEWRSQLQELRAEYATATREGSTSETANARREELARSLERVQTQRPFDRSLQIYRLEYHKKFSIPFAAVSFVVLAFPLGLFSRRSGRGVGFGIGLLVATLYWAMLIAGQTFGTQRVDVSPWLAMWAPNILFMVVGAGVFWRRARQ